MSPTWQADSLSPEPPWKPHTWAQHNTVKHLCISLIEKNKFWLWHMFTLGILREITAVWSSVCCGIQGRESNLWAGLAWDQRQGLWGSNAQHDAGKDKSPAVAVKRNDKGELWFLHRVNISNLHNLDTTFEETSDGKGAIVKNPHHCWSQREPVSMSWNLMFGRCSAVWPIDLQLKSDTFSPCYLSLSTSKIRRSLQV